MNTRIALALLIFGAIMRIIDKKENLMANEAYNSYPHYKGKVMIDLKENSRLVLLRHTHARMHTRA